MIRRALALCWLSVASSWAQQLPEPLAAWSFRPSYTLPGRAHNHPGLAPIGPMPAVAPLEVEAPALRFLGHDSSERLRGLLRDRSVPTKNYSFEMWVTMHVNRPVGALLVALGGTDADRPGALLGFHGRTVAFGPTGPDGAPAILVESPDVRPWKKWWHHLVGTFDGRTAILYHNGTEIARAEARPANLPQARRLDVLSFLESEPYMDLGNLLTSAAVYDEPLDVAQVRRLYAHRQSFVEQGILFDDGTFHFTAGPYLNTTTQTTQALLWETDRAATGIVEWGETTPLDRRLVLAEPTRLQEVILDGLRADTPYFYRVSAIAGGDTIDSGLLTFRSAVRPEQPWSFAIIGDTEARPHVNDRVAKQVWGERPHLAVILGDLTDGGKKDHRYEWTHEYFPGMTQLVSRVPTIAVAGNGESDLVWFRHYQNLPGPENTYSFVYGNAEFFMLDSNLGARQKEDPDFRQRQRAWLEQALTSSTARWKIAAHHHPVYTSDEDDYGDTWTTTSDLGDTRVRNDFMDLYEEHGVDLVLFGHLHTYERSWPIKDGAVSLLNGVIYVQAGGGGGNTEDFSPTHNWFSHGAYRGYHYGMFHVAGDYLEFRSRDTEGRLRDHFALRKGASGRGILVGTE